MRKMLCILAFLSLSSCGSQETIYEKDGICYSKNRDWMIWTYDTRTYQTDYELCHPVTTEP